MHLVQALRVSINAEIVAKLYFVDDCVFDQGIIIMGVQEHLLEREEREGELMVTCN